MPAIYQGDKKIVDRYVGETLVTRAYQGDKLIFDAYSELSGTLPLYVRSRASQILQNYIIYGTSSGAGVRTENLFDVSDYSVGAINFITKRITLEPNVIYTMSSDCPLYNLGALIAIGNVGESFTTAKNGVYTNHPISRTTDANGELVIGLRTNGSDYTLSDYDTMLNVGSTAPLYEPYGYKLPILLKSGNLFTETGSGLIQVTNSSDVHFGKSLGKLPAGDYSITYTRTSSTNLFITKRNNDSYSTSEMNPSAFFVSSTDDEIIVRTSYASDDKTWAELGFTDIVVAQQSNYNLYIGDTQLGEEEYVDYEEQKIYKLVDGTLTPTDPPVPLPDIALPQGTVAIDIEGTSKSQATVKGRINPTV